MDDQAQILRGLMERRGETPAASGPVAVAPRARTIAVVSGKGGVGKSNIALNLGVALAQEGQATCVVDANPGLGNIDLLCGLGGYWNLSHVFSGARSVPEILLDGPAGLRIVPGAGGLLDMAAVSGAAPREVISQLQELEGRHDFVIVDTGAGLLPATRRLVSAAEMALVVTTPEPTAMADAYATIKALSGGRAAARLHLVVNLADSPEEAREVISRIQQTARTFLEAPVGSAGFIPRDPAVPQAVSARRPFYLGAPHSAAARAVAQLARVVSNLNTPDSVRTGYFERLASRDGLAAA